MCLKGITLRGMRKLRERIEALCNEGFFLQPYTCFKDGQHVEEHGTAATIHELTTTQLVAALVMTQSGERCMADDTEWVLPEDVGTPSYFVSHAWKSTVSKVLWLCISWLSSHLDNVIAPCVMHQKDHSNRAKQVPQRK